LIGLGMWNIPLFMSNSFYFIVKALKGFVKSDLYNT